MLAADDHSGTVGGALCETKGVMQEGGGVRVAERERILGGRVAGVHGQKGRHLCRLQRHLMPAQTERQGAGQVLPGGSGHGLRVDRRDGRCDRGHGDRPVEGPAGGQGRQQVVLEGDVVDRAAVHRGHDDELAGPQAQGGVLGRHVHLVAHHRQALQVDARPHAQDRRHRAPSPHVHGEAGDVRAAQQQRSADSRSKVEPDAEALERQTD